MKTLVCWLLAKIMIFEFILENMVKSNVNIYMFGAVACFAQVTKEGIFCRAITHRIFNTITLSIHIVNTLCGILWCPLRESNSRYPHYK